MTLCLLWRLIGGRLAGTGISSLNSSANTSEPIVEVKFIEIASSLLSSQ
jgi:hypothetical protein